MTVPLGPWATKGEGSDPAPAALARSFDDFMTTFSAFKAENDTRLKAIEVKGAADPLVEEKVNRALADAMEKVKALQGDIAELKRAPRPTDPGGDGDAVKHAHRMAIITKAEGGALKSQGFHKVDETKMADGFAAYDREIKTYLRFGEDVAETKALAVAGDPKVGYFVQPIRSDRIITKIRDTSPMRQYAGSVSITGPSIEFPVDRGDADCGWVGEKTSRSETDIDELGETKILVHELYAKPKATQNLLDDAGIDIEAWLDGKVSDKFTRVENAAFVNGNGVKQPRGFMTLPKATTKDTTRAYGTLQYVATGAAGAFATTAPADVMIDAVMALHSSYRQGATWAMNRATLSSVMKLKDGQGNYLMIPMFRDNRLMFTALGYPIAEFEDMADIASGSFSIAFANFASGYLIVDRQGIRQLRDPYSSKPYVEFYTTKRVGGDVIESDAIKIIKFAAS